MAASALVFAGLEAGAGAMQRDADIPSTVVAIVEAAVILAVVGVQASRVRAARPDGGAAVTAPALR